MNDYDRAFIKILKIFNNLLIIQIMNLSIYIIKLTYILFFELLNEIIIINFRNNFEFKIIMNNESIMNLMNDLNT